MPEGPEIWILSQAINKYYGGEYAQSYGKHLIYKGQDWSFGLTGKVNINDDDVLEKINTGIAYGELKENFSKKELNIGLDWMNESDENLYKITDTWKSSKKNLGPLMLDQSQIAGIGVAWGSEILNLANCKPHIKACDQAERLHEIVDAMKLIRLQIMNLYTLILFDNRNNLKIFINKWFKNLYKVRQMTTYKKGKKIAVSGRNWYIYE